MAEEILQLVEVEVHQTTVEEIQGFLALETMTTHRLELITTIIVLQDPIITTIVPREFILQAILLAAQELILLRLLIQVLDQILIQRLLIQHLDQILLLLQLILLQDRIIILLQALVLVVVEALVAGAEDLAVAVAEDVNFFI